MVSEEKILKIAKINTQEQNFEEKQQIQLDIPDLHENLTIAGSHHAEHFYPIRFWLNLTVLRYMLKTAL